MENVSDLEHIDKINVNENHNVTPPSSVKTVPRLMYSREMLMKLKNHPQSKKKPASFDASDMVSKNGLWDPEHWISSDTSKRTTTTSAPANKEENQDKVISVLQTVMMLQECEAIC